MSPTPAQFREAIALYKREWVENPGQFAYVYAIQAGEDGPIKIGVTESPDERLKTLQQGNHQELHGIAAWWDFRLAEKTLHEDFAHARIRGEWFEPVPELVETVLAMGRYFCDWIKD